MGEAEILGWRTSPPCMVKSLMKIKPAVTAALAVAALLFTGCVPVATIDVVRGYAKHEPNRSLRARLVVIPTPHSWTQYVGVVRLPGGKAHLVMGRALDYSYKEVLRAHFKVYRKMRSADYAAYVDFGTIKFGATAVLDPTGQEANVVLEYSHEVRIVLNFDGSLKLKVPVSARMERTLPYVDDKALAAEIARLVGGEFLPEIERAFLSSVRELDDGSVFMLPQ